MNGASGDDHRIPCAVVGLKQGLQSAHVLLHHPAFALKAVCSTSREPWDWVTGKIPLESSLQDFAHFPHVRNLVAEIRKSPGLGAIEYIADFEAVLRRPDIQAVLLFVPDALHESYALAALRAGKSVLCTKPMALTLVSAQAIAAEARRHPHRYMLGFHFCYSPFAQGVAEQIRGGAVGTVRQLSFNHHRGQFRPVFRTRAISGGPIVQECCHWFDLFYFLAGKSRFTRIAAFGGRDVFRDSQDIEDNAALIFEYENRVRGALLFTYFRATKNSEFFTLNGDRGQIRGSFNQIMVENDAGQQVIAFNNRRLPGVFHDGFGEMHDEFAAMIRENREPYSGWEAGLENVLISGAAQRALDGGLVVARGD